MMEEFFKADSEEFKKMHADHWQRIVDGIASLVMVEMQKKIDELRKELVASRCGLLGPCSECGKKRQEYPYQEMFRTGVEGKYLCSNCYNNRKNKPCP